MDPRAEYMALVLEKLGTPLLAAVHEVGNRQALTGSAPPTPRDDAEKMATLLGLITKAGIDLSARLDLKADEDTADGLRLAVTALVSPLVASVYQMTGRMPGEAEIERLQAGFETVLAYADNFGAAADIRDRLQGLDREWAPSDAAQVNLQYFQILVPVISAVLAFPFGQPEKKLLNDVTSRLLADSRACRAELFPEETGTAATKLELSYLRACALLYSQCHYAEMARLMSMGEKARDVPLSPDSVMRAYEVRLAMLNEMGRSLLFGDEDAAAASGASGGGYAPPQQQTQQPPQQPPQTQAQQQAPAIFSPPPAANTAPVQEGVPDIFAAPRQPSVADNQPSTFQQPPAYSPPPAAAASAQPQQKIPPQAPPQTTAAGPLAAESGNSDNPMAFFVKRGES